MDRNRIFWDAFLEGLTAPKSLYEPPPPYENCVVGSTLAQTFAQVGQTLTLVAAPMLDDGRSKASEAE